MRWLAIPVLLLALWANNASVFVNDGGTLRLLAHRGVHQTYAGGVPDNDTCTAHPINPVRHPYIENTLPSMTRAFELGAEVVEIDVHLTPDGVFAVYHDWRLECRTNGTGQTNDTPFSVLQTLDAGYGYSEDGQTFPLRGTGLGAIPRLRDVFDTHPDGRFLINFKSNRRSEGRALAQMLIETPAYAARTWAVYGGWQPSQEVTRHHPEIRNFDWGAVRRCLTRYMAIGWTGLVPASCERTMVLVPSNYARLLWGWPHRFERRMAGAGTEILLVGPYRGRRSVSGIDTPEALSALPKINAWVWTNDLPALTD